MDNTTAKENQFHFLLMAYARRHTSKFIALKKWEKMQHIEHNQGEDEKLC
jgi:hypothetical protein